MAYKQDLGDSGFASIRYGMGIGIDDRVAIFVAILIRTMTYYTFAIKKMIKQI